MVTPQAYTYDLGVGISSVLEIIGHFLLKEGTSVGPLHMVMIYKQSDAT
jgi:hypothetical protein